MIATESLDQNRQFENLNLIIPKLLPEINQLKQDLASLKRTVNQTKKLEK